MRHALQRETPKLANETKHCGASYTVRVCDFLIAMFTS